MSEAPVAGHRHPEVEANAAGDMVYHGAAPAILAIHGRRDRASRV